MVFPPRFEEESGEDCLLTELLVFREGASSRKGESLRPAGAVVTKGTELRAGRGLREGYPAEAWSSKGGTQALSAAGAARGGSVSGGYRTGARTACPWLMAAGTAALGKAAAAAPSVVGTGRAAADGAGGERSRME